MAFLANDAVNRVNLHSGIQALAQNGGGVFLMVFLLRAHVSMPAAFLAFAAWTLIPDKFEQKDAPAERSDRGVFITTAIAFFLVEMGDKTQVVTVALAARFHTVLWVAAGTTLGMMIADVPAVFISQAAATKLPLKAIRYVAAASFAALGVWILVRG